MTLIAERLRSLISYNRASGVMHWRVRLSNRVAVGSEAGSARSDGFRKVVIDGKSYLAHLLCFLYVTGKLPEGRVIFKNGQRADTRWRNLRTA
jgi:hypothetical protein